MGDEDAVRLQGTVPESDYEYLADKFHASADSSDTALLRAMVDYIKRQERLDEMRATGRRPDTESDEE